MLKRILFSIFILCVYTTIQAQSDKCYEEEWDWKKEDSWFIHWQTNSMKDGVFDPFAVPKFNNDILRILNNNDDLKPEDGWVLLQKDLGCEETGTAKPYAMFYNRYRGIVRIFGYHVFENATHGLMTVDWGNGNRSSALTYSNVFSRADDKYPSYDNDRVLVQIDRYANNEWWVADFQVAFDHNTILSQEGYNFDIRVYGVDKSDMKIDSKADLFTKSIEIKGGKSEKKPTEVDNTEKLLEWTVKGQKAVQSLQYNEWDDYLKSAKNTVVDAGNWAYNRWEKNGSFEWMMQASNKAYDLIECGKFPELLKKGAAALGEVNSTLGFAIDVLNTFVGKPSNASTPSIVQMAPMQTTGTIVSEGTIVTKIQHQNLALQLPGTKVFFPQYTCPLGVLNLKETPTVSVRKWEEKSTELYSFGRESIYEREEPGGYISKSCSPKQGYTERNDIIHFNVGEIHNEKWKSLRLTKIPEIAINSAAKLELVEAKVAFIGMIKRKSSKDDSEDYQKGAYDPFEKMELLPVWYNENMTQWSDLEDYCGSGYGPYLGGYNISTRWINKTFDYLNSKTYMLLEGGEDLGEGKRNEFYKFRTGFVDIRNAEGLSFTVREETNVTMKLMAVFKEANNDNAPLMVFTNEYIINEPDGENDQDNKPYLFLREQLENADIYAGSADYSLIKDKVITQGTFSNGKIETNACVNATGEVSFKANHSIELKPNFSAKAIGSGTFSASIENGDNIVDANTTPLNKIAKYYVNGVEYDHYVSCDCSPKNINSGRFGVEEETNSETNCRIFPNPALDIINIEYHSQFKGISKLTIHDMKGVALIEKQISTGFEQLDLSNLNQGMYVMKISNDQESINRKIIKR